MPNPGPSLVFHDDEGLFFTLVPCYSPSIACAGIE